MGSANRGGMVMNGHDSGGIVYNGGGMMNGMNVAGAGMMNGNGGMTMNGGGGIPYNVMAGGPGWQPR